jgi:hypothetical protein
MTVYQVLCFGPLNPLLKAPAIIFVHQIDMTIFCSLTYEMVANVNILCPIMKQDYMVAYGPPNYYCTTQLTPFLQTV